MKILGVNDNLTRLNSIGTSVGIIVIDGRNSSSPRNLPFNNENVSLHFLNEQSHAITQFLVGSKYEEKYPEIQSSVLNGAVVCLEYPMSSKTLPDN